VAKCAYRRERIREIEEKWIDENIEDEEERRRKKEILSIILERLGEKARALWSLQYIAYIQRKICELLFSMS
jgi:hypothetical protein